MNGLWSPRQLPKRPWCLVADWEMHVLVCARGSVAAARVYRLVLPVASNWAEWNPWTATRQPEPSCWRDPHYNTFPVMDLQPAQPDTGAG